MRLASHVMGDNWLYGHGYAYRSAIVKIGLRLHRVKATYYLWIKALYARNERCFFYLFSAYKYSMIDKIMK